MAPLLALLLAALLGSGRACPEPCACVDKYAHQFADCAYKELQAVPAGLPSNVTTLSLSANKISALPRGAFAEVTQVSSLWLAHNEIATIEPGALAVLAQLKNLDVSHNQIVEFPWQDLRNLSALQLLKMNNNRMAAVPPGAFRTLKDLRSLRINNNRFATLAEGIFDSLGSLSHLQIYNNPFECSCALRWLKRWMESTLISIPEKDSIACALPERLRGVPLARLPELPCAAPAVSISASPGLDAAALPEGLALSLQCLASGSPPPDVRWRIRTAAHSLELGGSGAEGAAKEAPRQEPERLVAFKNGTLVIPRLSKGDEGTYTCVATNEVGSNHSSVSVAVAGAQKYPPGPGRDDRKGQAGDRKGGAEGARNSVLTPEESGKALGPTRQSRPSSAAGPEPEGSEEPPGLEKKCGSAAGGTKYVSNHAFNQSGDFKRHSFELGVIALDVAERDARVQLTPTEPGRGRLGVLYLCRQGRQGSAPLQWSHIEAGVNSYWFQGLSPGTNYSVCLSSAGEECRVQVVFTTKREIPSLVIIVVVAVFLLLLATLPLLGATWCHLLAKLQAKPYKLIMKAQNPDQMEKRMAADFDPRASYLESEKNFGPGEAGEAEEDEEEEEEGDEEGARWRRGREGEGAAELEREESVAASSMAESQSKGGAEEFEVRSEYSDKLPLGAEAVTISPEINGNYRQRPR
ncbi:LOW QUALITY PROTEIN: immunoglobulin superfamily containing leucine-rich repeat protein 2-like [Prinia subflava]|uniref:LOW QUALITY PROTEIN: immunoglobulin superfamily containing leucine-rich repeat protein 2-like n=1 Tax=Prinia subflava TaxID=208062 RepID=UPI002FDF2AD5